MTPDYDSYTIRLPAGRKAEVRLPTVFTQDDAERIKRWLDLIASNSMEDNQASKESGDE